MASIRMRGDKWQVRVTRKGQLPVAKTFNNRSDAVKWARAVEREIDLGSYIRHTVAERSLLGDVFKRYREEVAPVKRGAEIEVLPFLAVQPEEMPVAKATARVKP